MKFVMETNEGKKLDLNTVKYITFDGIEYAMMPVIQFIDQKKLDVGNKFIETLFGVEEVAPKTRGRADSVSGMVNQWLNASPKRGETVTFQCNTDHAIRVPCEKRNSKVLIRRIRKGLYSATYQGKFVYARSRAR